MTGGRNVTFHGASGGCGTTTTAAMLALVLAETGRTVEISGHEPDALAAVFGVVSTPAPAELEREAVLGPAEIAERLEVRRATVHQWRQRALLPDPDLTVSGTPVWYAGTVDAWAMATGRAK